MTVVVKIKSKVTSLPPKFLRLLWVDPGQHLSNHSQYLTPLPLLNHPPTLPPQGMGKNRKSKSKEISWAEINAV